MYNTENIDPVPFVKTDRSTGAILLAAAIGLAVSFYLLPEILPSLAHSMAGSEPMIYWYLSRGSAFVAFGLLWLLSMVMGLALTAKIVKK